MKQRTTRQRDGGLTLVELMLAMAGVGLIGLAIVSMMSAVSYGSTNHRELRSLTVKNKTLSTRIKAAIRNTSMVLAADDDYLILWVNDADTDGTPSLHEIQRIDRDSTTNDLSSYVSASGSPNTPYLLTDNFVTLTDALMGGSNFTADLWSTDIDLVTFALDTADAQSARLISFRLIGRNSDITDTAIEASALRNQVNGS